MRDAMNRLAQFLGRRRRWVVAAWVLIVLLALPFASKQTDHLTGGGFDVPGSQSMKVSESLQEDFGSQADGIAVVLKAAPGASAAERDAAVARVGRRGGDARRRHPAAGRRRRRRGGSCSSTTWSLVPLRSDLSSDELIDPAATLREDLDPGDADGGVTPYLVGQPTIWAGMQEISKEDLAKAESSGFPIVAIILLVVFGSLAAAALPLALGFVSVLVTGALIYFISLQIDDLGLRHQHGLDDRDRRRRRLLALHPRPLPRGARSRARAGRGAGAVALDLGPRRHLLRPGGDHLPGRAVDGRQPGAALDGAGGDDRGRGLDPHRDDAAAGADRDARRPRPAGRGRRQGRGASSGAASTAATPPSRPAAEHNRFWRAWTARVMARPWTAVIGVSAVLLFLASPLLSLETGTEALAQFPKDSDVRVGSEIASAQLGGGTDPVQIVASFDGGRARRQGRGRRLRRANWEGTQRRQRGRRRRSTPATPP